MPQNLLSLTLSDADVAAIGNVIGEIEARLTGLVALDNETRRAINKMGDKSEAFVRQTIIALAQNPEIVPPGLGLAEAQADLQAIDQLRPLLMRLQRLVELMSDSEMALGSDAMNVALEGYALLRISGRNKGLEGLRESLSARFARSPRKAVAAAAG